MGYRSRWLAVSATVPRLDLLKYPEGGPRAAASALKMLLPGWHLTGRTVGMRGGRGPEHRIFLGTWGSTIVLGGNGSVLSDLEWKLFSKRRRPDAPGVWSMWASTVIDSMEFSVKATDWNRYVCTERNDYFGEDEDESGGDMSLATPARLCPSSPACGTRNAILPGPTTATPFPSVKGISPFAPISGSSGSSALRRTSDGA